MKDHDKSGRDLGQAGAEAPREAAEIGIMAGFPPPPEQRPNLSNWDLAPFNRWSFQHLRELLPTAEVRRAPGHASRFERDERDLDGLTFAAAGGRRISLADMLAETYSDGFLVLHRGRIVMERYFNGMTEETLHLSQSVSKSLVGALAGILAGRGALDLEAPLPTYVPELAGCGYADATLQHLLDMRSGVRFSEDYGDPEADITKLELVCGWKPRPAATEGDLPACLYDLVLTLPKERPHGSPFLYRSAETDVIGWVLERTSGLSLSELMSRELWQPLGCERDACFTVDSAGSAMADGGFYASLRDYARFGQMHCDGGRFNGRQIVPESFVLGSRTGDVEAFVGDYKPTFPRGAYRNQFWIRDVDTAQYMARGVFGQLIYIDAPRRLVVVKLSSWPDYRNFDFLMTTLAAIDAIAAALGGDAA